MQGQVSLLMFSLVFGQILPSSISPSTVPSAPTKKSGCIKVSHCKCIMMDGSGVIDLATLGDPDGFLERFKPLLSEGMPASAEVLLSFSPCLPFSEPEDFSATDCSAVAACLNVRIHEDKRYISNYINYGRHVDNKFHYNSSMKTLSVSYSAKTLTKTHPCKSGFRAPARVLMPALLWMWD
uniref:Uncharacterized protein n=1 Tax=Denticeps clupeoides TaxID=299321 RepID=A0AAY4DYG2_9TELE